MDLTLTDSEWRDVGTVEPTSGDFAYGNDENDFEVSFDGGGHMPEEGALLYADGSDIGGMVTGYRSDTDTQAFSVIGMTWTGLMNNRVLTPPSGKAYYSVSGDARDCVAQIVRDTGLGYLFTVAPGKSGVKVSRTFKSTAIYAAPNDSERYMHVWDAIWMLLARSTCSVWLEYDAEGKKVVIHVTARREWSGDEAASAGVAVIGVTRDAPVNHLVCLGSGEGAGRTVLHLYADSAGRVSTTQTLTGRWEIVDVYDDSGAEDTATLQADGTSKLKELYSDSQIVSVTAANENITYELGDLVEGTDEQSGVSARAIISKKVATFDRGSVSWSYTSSERG